MINFVFGEGFADDKTGKYTPKDKLPNQKTDKINLPNSEKCIGMCGKCGTKTFGKCSKCHKGKK